MWVDDKKNALRSLFSGGRLQQFNFFFFLKKSKTKTGRLGSSFMEELKRSGTKR